MPAKETRRSGRVDLGTYFAQHEILRGAAHVFADKGATDATVEDILGAARISRRTFYRAFANKEEVLAALYEVATQFLVDGVRAAASAPGTTAQKIERCVDAYLGFQRTGGALVRVLQAEALRPGSPLEARRQEVIRTLADHLDAEIAAGRRLDRLLVEGLLVALEGISRLLHVKGPPAETELARARRVMLRILRATLDGEGDGIPPLPLRRG